MVSAAAIAAARASISTPVRSMACTRASMRTTPAPSSQATSTSAPARTMGWQSGRMAGGHFAPQLVVVVGSAGKVSPVEQDGRTGLRRSGLRGRPEEAENPRRQRRIGGDEVADVRQVRDLEIRLRQAGFDRRWQLLELLLD